MSNKNLTPPAKKQLLFTVFYAILIRTKEYYAERYGLSMDWLKVKIFTTHQGCEFISSALYSMGIYGLEIFDPEDYKMPQKDYTWDYIDDDVLKKQAEEAYVCAYIGDAPAGWDQLSEIKGFLKRMPSELPDFDLGRLEVTVTNIQNEDWVNNWKKFFKPIEVANKFLIVPEWEENVDTGDRIRLTINPGGIFGTGSHETTQLCISAIEKAYDEKGTVERVMDIGTGSGILSIAAILLGCKYAECIDIDPNADTIVVENMEMNSISEDKYAVRVGNILDDAFADTLPRKGYGIVVANIMADIIIGMLPAVPQFMAKDALFITSGIIESRLEEVQNELEKAGFEVVSSTVLNEWCCITSRFRQ